MTRAEALQEARRRWGLKLGHAWTVTPYGNPTIRPRYCRVGTKSTPRNQVLGWGFDWEDAFGDADERAATDADQREEASS